MDSRGHSRLVNKRKPRKTYRCKQRPFSAFKRFVEDKRTTFIREIVDVNTFDLFYSTLDDNICLYQRIAMATEKRNYDLAEANGYFLMGYIKKNYIIKTDRLECTSFSRGSFRFFIAIDTYFSRGYLFGKKNLQYESEFEIWSENDENWLM